MDRALVVQRRDLILPVLEVIARWKDGSEDFSEIVAGQIKSSPLTKPGRGSEAAA